MMKHKVILVLLMVIKYASSSNEDRLVDTLLANNTRYARPYPDGEGAPVEVKMKMYIWAIDDLDAKKQYFHTMCILQLQWYDPRLKWNISEYDGLRKIAVHPSKIWLPRVALYNSVNELFQDNHYKHIYALVRHNGSILWMPGGQYVSSCNIDIRYFPFDEQICTMEFGEWVYSANEVNFTLFQNKIDLSMYNKHVQWEIVGTSARIKKLVDLCCPDEDYSFLHFSFHLRRKPLYFLVNIIIPSAMLSILLLLVFLLPPESGEKISLGITILLAYGLFILMISDSVPHSSDAVPLIVVYLMFFMGCATLSISLSVLVLHLHHKKDTNPPPRWLNNIAFCLSIMSRNNKLRGQENDKEESQNAGGNLENNFLANQTLKPVGIAEKWKDISQALDRLFFVLITLFLIVMSCTILGIIPMLQDQLSLS